MVGLHNDEIVMTNQILNIFLGITIGLGATLIMDLWLILRKQFFNAPPLNYCYLGRWLLHMPDGVFKHANIGAARPKNWECAVGRLAHYAIGAIFGVTFIGLVSPSWLQAPTILPPMLWGLTTVAAPFLLMQPAFGLGIAASKTRNPMAARLQSILTHAVFGIGLYVCAFALSSLL